MRFRLYHVRGDQLIKKILFDSIETTTTAAHSGRIDESYGITSYGAMADYVINSSGGTVKSVSNNVLLPYGAANVNTSALISNGFHNWLDFSENGDIEINDRFYVNRWDANHSYIMYTGISAGLRQFVYYTKDAEIVYRVGINQIDMPPGYSLFYSLPWLTYWGDDTNYNLVCWYVGYWNNYGAFLDCTVNGNYAAPVSIALAKKFWEDSQILNNIDAKIGEPMGGDPDYDNFIGDDIPMPGAPDESVSGVLASGFLNIYKPSDSDLRSFGAALWTNAFNVKWSDIDSVSNLILNAVSNPIDFIIGLFMLPVTPSVGASSGIYLGGINVNTISAPRVSSQYVTIDFGTIDITELYANYLDYSNSRVSIYLPYVGTADIDVQEITGGSVTLRYIVDVFTGACVANVRCVKTTPAPWGLAYKNETIHSYSGNMAIQLPISAGSFDTLTQGLINVGLGLGTNTPAIAMTGAKDVVQGFAGDVTTRGSLSSNTGKLGYQTPYLMFTRPIESRPANLGSLHGYSAGVGGILSQFSGYVVCSDVKLDGVTATDSELNEIESILKSGVYV